MHINNLSVVGSLKINEMSFIFVRSLKEGGGVEWGVQTPQKVIFSARF